MNLRYCFLFALPISGICLPLTSWAGPQAQVVCAYDHTLGDDPILMPGKANQAMMHDFYGNTSTSASSTNDSLLANPGTSCDNQADTSAYWSPTMKLPDGTIVKPSYQKTYYQSTQVDQYPLSPFPKGLQLLAGDHYGTGPNPHVDFSCADGDGYSTTAGEVCHLRSAGDAVQFNVGVTFPNCWDGKTLDPTLDKPNATYATNGACPADFPVKIPTVNMNIAWVLPQITSLDTAKVQFSMDPTMNGDTRTENWGSVYTAHGDFMNAWTDDARTFMTDLCMNLDMDCGTNVPYHYSKANADTYVSSVQADTNFSQETQLLVQDDWSGSGRDSHPETVSLIKFAIPPLPENIPSAQTAGGGFTYQIRLYGNKEQDNGADEIFFYPVEESWDENSVTWNTHPACDYDHGIPMNIDNEKTWRYVNVDSVVRTALQNGKTEIAWCIGGDRQGDTFTFVPANAKESLVLMLVGYKNVPQP